MFLHVIKIFIFSLLMTAFSVHAEEFTHGAKELFQEFSTCQTSAFEFISKNKENYLSLGKFKEISSGGEWFDTKQLNKDSSDEIYQFDKPIKIAGLTAVAVGYSFFKGDGKGYSGGDATYWGFYFSEPPNQVFLALRKYYPSVAAMVFLGDNYVNMKVLQRDGDKVYDQGSIIESDTTQNGAKSYFNCSIQYKILEKSNTQKPMSKEDELLLNELIKLDKSDLLKLCFEDASNKSTADIHKAGMACSALNKKR